ncbi:MAG: hypothetical protein JNN00_14435 [Chitinophagaceae bacterium]|nr:hypothetical protein [Chitinophagaceae bacterium]
MPVKNALIILWLLFQFSVSGQVPVKSFVPDSLTEDHFRELRKEFGKNKQYPSAFEKQILIALSYYPELRNTYILFRIRHRHPVALTRAAWGGVFVPAAKRHYVITISDSTEAMLSPILFIKQSFNAQIGIIGHELGHVVQYSRMTTLQLIQYAVSNISAKYIDRFEYNADATSIAHGLGYQLLEWSRFVRKAMNTENWGGPDLVHRQKGRERYMNPATILKRISEDAIYGSIH